VAQEKLSHTRFLKHQVFRAMFENPDYGRFLAGTRVAHLAAGAYTSSAFAVSGIQNHIAAAAK
jgi:hypothetical protein